MASVREIAKHAEVSIATVSRVLNNHPRVSPAMRQKVQEAVNELHYVPTVGRRSTAIIALVYTAELSLGSPFDACIMEGMVLGMQEQGYDLMVLDSHRARGEAETYTQMFMRKGVRGAILRTTAQSHSICERIAEEGFPAVVVGDRLDGDNVSFVYSDSRGPSREAVEHLIDLGHDRIAICLNVVDDHDHTDRLTAYQAALQGRGLAFDERLVLRVPVHRGGGAQALKRIMTIADRPTAVFMADPLAAVGLLLEAQREGLEIPRDLSVVGFDDSDVRHSVVPRMTAVCQDALMLGRQAVASLLDLIDGRVVGEAIQSALPTWFEIHESTASHTGLYEVRM